VTLEAPFSRGAFLFVGEWVSMRIGFGHKFGELKRWRASASTTVATILCCAALLLLTSVARGAQSAPPAAQTNPETAKAAAPLIVKDEAGRRVEVPQPVRRIISLAPSLTETIYALGLQDRLVADTDFCDYPAEAKKLPKVGGPFTPNLEVILSLKPDIVLLAANSANRKETADALDLLHVPAYATNARTIDDVIASIARLGEVLGAADQGHALADSLRARLDALHRKLGTAAPVRVLFVVWQEPLISIGQETFLADAMRWAGAESVIRTKQDWPHVNLEEAVKQQPEYLVFASAHPEEITASLANMRTLPGWRDMKALQENRVVIVSDAINRPAPRLVDAIEELARDLHPEVFAEGPHASLPRWNFDVKFPVRQAAVAPEEKP
jgi:iron complex transport system substrate-binding protein